MDELREIIKDMAFDKINAAATEAGRYDELVSELKARSRMIIAISSGSVNPKELASQTAHPRAGISTACAKYKAGCTGGFESVQT